MRQRNLFVRVHVITVPFSRVDCDDCYFSSKVVDPVSAILKTCLLARRRTEKKGRARSLPLQRQEILF